MGLPRVIILPQISWVLLMIRMALSETRQGQLEGRIARSRGAYFTDTLKRLTQYHTTHNI
jgi:hypothetical protein